MVDCNVPSSIGTPCFNADFSSSGDYYLHDIVVMLDEDTDPADDTPLRVIVPVPDGVNKAHHKWNPEHDKKYAIDPPGVTSVPLPDLFTRYSPTVNSGDNDFRLPIYVGVYDEDPKTDDNKLVGVSDGKLTEKAQLLYTALNFDPLQGNPLNPSIPLGGGSLDLGMSLNVQIPDLCAFDAIHRVQDLIGQPIDEILDVDELNQALCDGIVFGAGSTAGSGYRAGEELVWAQT